MDIAYVAPVLYPFIKGGAEKRIYEIGRRLASRGHDVTVYSRHWWDGEANKQFEDMEIRAIAPSREIYTDKDRRSITSALTLSSKLFSPLQSAEHSILITPVAPYFHIFTSYLSSINHNTELVVTWHEVWNDYWYDYMGKLGIAGKTIEQVTALFPHHPVVPSRTTALRLQNHLGVPQSEIKVIPNGIDIASIRQTDPVNDGFDILYAGRLIKDKNIDIILEAVDAINQQVTLGIIGDGPQYETLTAQAKELNSSDSINFLGFLDSHNNVISHMRAADIFISPSIREGFGITYLEAMAAGCKVIAAKDPNSAAEEVIGNAGFVVEPTVQNVTRILQQALNGRRPKEDPQERAASYDWNQITDEVEDFLKTIRDTKTRE